MDIEDSDLEEDNLGCLTWLVLALFVCILLTLLFMGWVRMLDTAAH